MKNTNTRILVRVDEHRIGKRNVAAVNARELHAFLEVKTKFTDWIEMRIRDYELVEGIDFQSLSGNRENSKDGRPTVDYWLTISTARELAVVEKNSKGWKIRRYFIKVEEDAKRAFENSKVESLFLLNDPTDWEMRFPEMFFKQVMRLNNQPFKYARYPGFVGSFINKYVYDHIWDGLSDELKAKRNQFSMGTPESRQKLHQFLDCNAAKELASHVQRVTGLMMASDDMEHFIHNFKRMFENQKQMLLQLAHALKRRAS